MKNYSLLLMFLCFGMSLLSCKHTATDSFEEELSAFMDSQIDFPLDSMLYMGDSTTDFHREKYMYVVYTDTSSCSECAIKNFSDWADLDLQSCLERQKLSYMFIVAPPRNLRKRIIDKIRQDCLFRSFVFVDTSGCFERQNPSLLRREMMHSFLVDDSSRVKLVGNPTINNKVKSLLLKMIVDSVTDKSIQSK